MNFGKHSYKIIYQYLLYFRQIIYIPIKLHNSFENRGNIHYTFRKIETNQNVKTQKLILNICIIKPKTNLGLTCKSFKSFLDFLRASGLANAIFL